MSTEINTLGNGKMPQQQTFLESTLEQIRIQNDQWRITISILQNGGIVSLDSLANKLNSLEYSKNHENRADSGSNISGDPSVKPKRPDGLVGNIMEALEEGNSIRYNFESQVLPELNVAIEYIERHI